MYTWKRTHGIAALLTLIAMLAVFAGQVQAGNSRPTGMSKAEYRSLMLRSQALNERYGLGNGTSKPAGMSWPEFRALMLRSKALDAKYGAVGSRVAAPAVTVAEGSFAWGDFGLGAAAMLGLVLVATGLVAGTRRIPRARISS